MRILGSTANWLFMLCLPVLLLTASIGVAVNSLWLYEKGFEKYGVKETTGLAGEELEAVARGLVGYFNSGDEHISLTVKKDGEPFILFNQREVVHLRDVKDLIWLDYWVLLGTLLYVVGYAVVSLFRFKEKYRLGRGVIGGTGITVALMVGLGVATVTGFDRLFWQFHLLSFTNDLWQLDPARDYLIMLFPQGFFYDAALFCALATAAGAVVLGATAKVYLRKANPPAQSSR